MSALILIIMLALLVLVHEYGHFIVAKKSGMRVDEFGIGFPPKLWSKKSGETEYSVNAIPFGGFVRIFGEDPLEVAKHPDDASRSFYKAHRLKQVAVIVAGVIFNWIFAVLLLALGFMIGMPVASSDFPTDDIKDEKVLITEVLPGSPAELAGLESGQILIAIAPSGEQFVSSPSEDEIVEIIGASEGKTVEIVYDKYSPGVKYDPSAHKYSRAQIEPQSGVIPGSEAPSIGIGMQAIGTVNLPPHRALWHGFTSSILWTSQTVSGFVGLVTDALSGEGSLDSVSGPVGIASLVGSASEAGLGNLLLLAAIISISLAVINIVPFPALDGGRLLFIIIESITGKEIPPRISNWFNLVGFVALIVLMVVVTYNDIINL